MDVYVEGLERAWDLVLTLSTTGAAEVTTLCYPLKSIFLELGDTSFASEPCRSVFWWIKESADEEKSRSEREGSLCTGSGQRLSLPVMSSW